MSTIFTIRKNYSVKRDDPKIATKGYHQLLFHDVNYNLFFDIDKVPKDGEKSIFSFF